MNNVVITGISGFVGTQLKTSLQKEYNVIGMSLRGGVTDKEIPDCQAVIHLAGKAHDVANTSEDAAYYLVNTDYTIALFDTFLASTATTFIFISSVKAVADTVEGVLTETSTSNPITPYGISKLKAEHYLLKQPLPEHKRLYILRPCMIHGPGNKGNLNLLYALVEKGIPYPLGAFKNQRSFLHISNLCYVIEQLLIQQPDSAVFNVADDDPLSTNQLVSLIYQSLHKKPRIIAVPKAFIGILSALGTLLSLPFNKEKVSKLTENYIVSNKKIKDTLGIEKTFCTTEGLLQTFNSFKKI